MKLKPGAQLASTACNTQVMVVRVPAADVEIACGGRPMVPAESSSGGTEEKPEPGHDGGTVLGKRYEAAALGLELLCTKAGAGSLAANGQPLEVKQPKDVPSSD